AKGTPQRRKHRQAVARVHERIAWRRENFTHQHSRKIVNQSAIICVEDLNVNRMVHTHCLAKSISDVAWSAFFDQLASKAEEAGRELIRVNPAYTSQTCSRCGHRQKMPLSERTYHCPCCLLVIRPPAAPALASFHLSRDVLQGIYLPSHRLLWSYRARSPGFAVLALDGCFQVYVVHGLAGIQGQQRSVKRRVTCLHARQAA